VPAVLALLGACSTLGGGGPQPGLAEPDVPAAWSGAAVGGTDAGTGTRPGTAGSLVQWWQGLGDPVLSGLIVQALQANTDVLGAQAALRQARALRDVAAAGLLPALGTSASAQRASSGGLDAAHSSNSFHVGLDASWEVDLFGGQRNALAAADATARASAANLGQVQITLAAEVALSYITLRSGQARGAIAQANLDSQLQTLQITEWRAQAGLLSVLEVQQARSAAAQTRAALPGLQTSTEQASHALAVLTGKPPAALADLLATARPVPQPAASAALSLPADTLRQRPDVRAAEQQVLAAQGRVAQADAARYPSFNLGGSIGLNALTLGALGNSAAVAGSLLASVSMPLFDGGAARAQVRAQQAALDQARSAYRATVLTALKDVEDALVALRGDRERTLRYQQAADSASQAASLARQRFASGLVDFQTVLDTQRSQLGTQDSVASASADVSTDHVRLYKALGGGWQADESAAPPTLASTAQTR
jgi:NodT family efflux transporter outer membrane factor (OMF) lipoprotein